MRFESYPLDQKNVIRINMSNTVRKHRPDMPEGMFGNPGKAKGRVINK